jgi:hypothetical protein
MMLLCKEVLLRNENDAHRTVYGGSVTRPGMEKYEETKLLYIAD